MNNSRTINSIRNIIAGFGGQALSLIISFVNRIVFVHVFAEAYLGINGLFTNVLSMLSLAELGISSAITYALYKPLANNNNDKIASLMNFYAKAYRVVGITVGVLGLCILPFLKIFISDPGNIQENIYIIYLLFLFNTTISYFYTYKVSLIIADQKSYISSIISYCILIIQTIIQIVIVVFIKNYFLYLICQSIGTILTNVLISKKADCLYPYLKNKNIKPLDKNDKKSLFTNIKALMIIKLSGVLVNSTDNIIISATNGLGLVSTGIASNYNLLSSTLNSILVQIFNGITASVGNFNASENDKRKIDFFSVINLLNFWLYGWCTISFIILSSDIIRILFGAKYILSDPVVFIIAINFYTVGMQSAVWTYKNTLGLFDYGKYLTFLTGMINIVLSIFLGQKWGLFGIFLATFISRLLTNIWYDPYAVYKYGLGNNPFVYFGKYIIYFIILLLCTFILIVIIKLFNISFIFKLIMCIVLPNVFFLLCFFKTKEYIFLFEKCKTIFSIFIKVDK